MILPLILALPFLGAFLPTLAERYGRLVCALATGLAPAMAFGLLLTQTGPVFSGETLTLHQPWLTELGLNLSLRLDGLSFLFALMILGIGLLVILYAHYYLGRHERSEEHTSELQSRENLV